MTGIHEKNFAFFGAGKMAEAIFSGMIASGAVSAQNICICDISQQRLNELATCYDVSCVPNDPKTNAELSAIAKNADVLVLAVKPQFLRPILEVLKGKLKPQQLVISIVGGATLELLESFISVPVVRVMPNTPMLVQEGVAGISLGSACKPEHGEFACALFDLLGKSYLIPEQMIDPLTGVSGCGPAYTFLFLEALADAGVEMGLPREMALDLAARTVGGAAKMVQEGGHPAQLKDGVCSPGGSTIAGVHALERGAFRGVVMDAAQAGMQRMIEVGKKI